MNALSLFSSAGIGEYYLREIGIDVVLANELVPIRAETHRVLYPSCEVINADIVSEDTQKEIVSKSKNKEIEVMIITPPCQGVSTVGKNKSEKSIFKDPRNYLILSALNIVAFDLSRRSACSSQCFLHIVGKSLDLAAVGTVGDDEVVCNYRYFADINHLNILGFFIL